MQATIGWLKIDVCACVCVWAILFSLVYWVADGLTFVSYMQISTDVQHTISSNN